MRLLAVPNWSFGRNQVLLRSFRDVLESHALIVHYCAGDIDHNRTVTAFSGGEEAVGSALLELCEVAFDVIDLNRHVGVHPRVGALDVCPFVLLDGDLLEALAMAERTASKIAASFDLPVFLYEKSERGRHESDLPTLRRGGFGSLAGKELNPDFGPTHAHPRLGVAIVGVRDFLISLNVNFVKQDPSFAKSLAKSVREMRANGDPRFLGVRAMGVPLPSKPERSQLSMTLTLPDLTSVDPIVEWAVREGSKAHVPFDEAELIGVIRDVDVAQATWLDIKPDQIVQVQVKPV